MVSIKLDDWDKVDTPDKKSDKKRKKEKPQKKVTASGEKEKAQPVVAAAAQEAVKPEKPPPVETAPAQGAVKRKIVPLDPNPYGEDNDSAVAREMRAKERRALMRDRRLLRRNRKQCKTLTRRTRQLANKIEEYNRKGNQTKVNAYTEKREQADEKLKALKDEIKDTFENTAIPPKELSNLAKQLESAGCAP